MNILEEQEDLTEEDEEMEEDGGGADQQVQYTYTIWLIWSLNSPFSASTKLWSDSPPIEWHNFQNKY